MKGLFLLVVFSGFSANALANQDFRSINKSLLSRPDIRTVPVRLGGKKKVTFQQESKAEIDRIKIAQCTADEGDFQKIQRELLWPMEKSFLERKAPKVFRDNSSLSDISASPDSTQISGNNLRLGASDKFELATGKEAVEKALGSYLNQYSKLESVNFSIFQYNSATGDRFENLATKKIDLIGDLDLRGIIGSDGGRRNDRMKLVLTASRASKEAPWLVDSIRVSKLERVESLKPTFQLVNAESGLEKHPSFLRLEAIRRGGFAVATGDYNGDKIPDLYVGSYGKSVLYKGTKDGKFEVDNSSGLSEVDRVKSASFADFNNDGLQDLLLVRFAGDDKVSGPFANQFGKDILLYRNIGNGKFANTSGISKNARTSYAMPSTVADFDNDGNLDFYVGFPGVKDFTSMMDVGIEKDVAVEGLFKNNGEFQFQMNRLLASDDGYTQERSGLQMLFPHSALATDFNQDGKMDILVIDDRGNLSPAYRNQGNGKFAQSNNSISMFNESYGMGVSTADFDNDGIMDIAITNVNTLAAKRIVQSCKANWHHLFDEKNSMVGLKLYKGVGGGQFVDYTDVAGLSWAGEGLGGVEFLDYNNDGFQDLVVSNGLWSGNDPKQDYGPYFFFSGKMRFSQHQLDETRESTVSSTMKNLMNFKGDLLSGTKGDSRPHLAGFQRKRLFRNLGTGKFLEVGYAEGMDSLADGYVFSKLDYNNDNQIDLIFRNADPGTEVVKYPSLELYKNSNPENTNVLRITLKGTKSNADAIGAEVKVKVGTQWQTQQLLGTNGTAQSEKTLHFGLGKAKAADLVVVKWPSMQSQELKNVKAGALTIEEKSENRISRAN